MYGLAFVTLARSAEVNGTALATVLRRDDIDLPRCVGCESSGYAITPGPPAGECHLQHLVHAPDEHELDGVAQVLGDLVYILLVQLGRNHLLDPVALCRQGLLLQAADRQDQSSERDLSG